MSRESAVTRWFPQLNWEELFTLAICLTLDILDYLIPLMSTPILGDILDIAGIIFVFMFFNYIGALSILELIPGSDVIPVYTVTWITWYLIVSRKRKKQLAQELDDWR